MKPEEKFGLNIYRVYTAEKNLFDQSSSIKIFVQIFPQNLRRSVSSFKQIEFTRIYYDTFNGLILISLSNVIVSQIFHFFIIYHTPPSADPINFLSTRKINLFIGFFFFPLLIDYFI